MTPKAEPCQRCGWRTKWRKLVGGQWLCMACERVLRWEQRVEQARADR